MVASSSIAIGEGLDVGPFYFLNRHLVFLALGIGLAVWAMRTELKTVERYNQLLLLGCVVLLLAVFVPGVGQSVNGARRWINLGLSNFQVVEAVKLLRSEEHTSELQSLMRISYAVFCLKKKIKKERR